MLYETKSNINHVSNKTTVTLNPADKYIWADNVMPKFHVMNPPDLRDADKRARLNEVSTNFWMWQYQQYLNDFPDIDYQKDFYNKKYLKDFFSQIDYTQYRRM
ncbi:hypothetical protein KIN20_009170 [Parelaphostrongylus tenuis]|uniref:Uncharacterized protein n=1 Tax=Parelaphostrongylus tenuis TaxID=148309 RepID=A0AAD5MQ75_PARTN|nr:hypothetical protein KIN20_009170 [Parelaphostrongylus tenuis]